MGLVEILVACAVIATGLVALSSMIPLAITGAHDGYHLSAATFLAVARLEQVKAATWTSGPPPATCPSGDCVGVSAGDTAPEVDRVMTFADEMALTPPYTKYTRRLRIVDCDSTSGCAGVTGSGLRRVTVTVVYPALSGVGQGGSRLVALSTLIARK
jgi:hypothetical protein